MPIVLVFIGVRPAGDLWRALGHMADHEGLGLAGILQMLRDRLGGVVQEGDFSRRAASVELDTGRFRECPEIDIRELAPSTNEGIHVISERAV